MSAGPAASDELLGQAALRRGYITPGQLKEALAEQAREVAAGRERPRPLLNILVSRGQLTAGQVAALRDGDPRGKYEVKEELARGGMGAILRAEDREIRRLVAMKVMLDPSDERSRARFLEEAQVTGQLEHPNIVPVHELGADEQGRPFFTMKLVKGKSLAEVLKGLRETRAEGEYTRARLLGIFVGVCNALAFAHSRGVVHRDLKPANLMLGDFGEVLVMDWGLAKVGVAVRPRTERFGPAAGGVAPPRLPRSADAALDERVRSLRQETPESLTMDGAIMGTPHYMPPEQANGDVSKIDARSDIYSLGAILYEILTLKPPAEGRTVTELLLNVTEGRIQPPHVRTPERNVSPELSAIAMKALATRPSARYPSAELLRRDIELFLEGRAVSAKPDSAWETVVKLAKRNKAASISSFAAAAVVMAVVATGYRLNLTARRAAEEQRTVAQNALASYKAEQERRVRQQKASAPSLLSKAQGSVGRKEWDAALQDVDLAVAFDPDLTAARFLKAELLAGRRDYAAAVAELEQIVRRVPGDPAASRLRDLCLQAGRGESTAVAASFTEFHLSRGEPELAAVHAGSRDALRAAYAGILGKAWPEGARRLVMNPDGSFGGTLDTLGIADLSPLKGIPFRALTLYNNPFSSVEPLRGMPLQYLHLAATNVGDIGPLRGMPLESVDLPGRVTDLRPLKGMALRHFSIYGSDLADLSPLAGMPLKSLQLLACRKVADLEVLRGMPLERLNLRGTDVADLSVLKGMPLKALNVIDCAKVTDLSPLEGMGLELLSFTPRNIREGMDVLRRMKTLTKIEPEPNKELPSAQFWQKYDLGFFGALSGRPVLPSIERWHVLGPLVLGGSDPLTVGRVSVESEVQDARGTKIRWKPVAFKDGVVNLAQACGTTASVAAFAYVEIPSAEAADIELVGGNDDTIVIWLNGSKVHEDRSVGGYVGGEFVVPARLAAGTNTLLVKCGNDGGGEWKFSVGVRPAKR